MKKKEKIKLEKLSVKSYITTLNKEETNKIKAGEIRPTMPIWCAALVVK